MISKLFALVVGGLVICSCSTVSGWIGLDDEQMVEVSGSNSNTQDAETEKKMERSSSTNLGKARIWARLDELEGKVRSQDAKIKLLEKGLMLGIIPEELKHPADRVSHRKPQPMLMPEVEHSEADIKPAVKTRPAAATTKPKPVDEKAYQAALASAQDFFRTGRYGKAINSFEKLADDYPDKVKDGSHRYWIGLSWYNMREFETAKKVFNQLISQHASSPWIARAKFNVARSNNSLGLKRLALGGLKDIIKSHPYEDAAEMARMEIERIEQAL